MHKNLISLIYFCINLFLLSVKTTLLSFLSHYHVARVKIYAKIISYKFLILQKKFKQNNNYMMFPTTKNPP